MVEQNAKGFSPWGRNAVPALASLAPGVGLCAIIAIAAYGIEHLERTVFGRAWLEGLVVAILLGAVVRNLWRPSARFAQGIAFSARSLLEIAVVLIGANISAEAIFSAGWPLIAGIALVVALSMAASFAVCRILGLGPKLALLVAAGNSICGNSAIAAVAPVIEAEPSDVAVSVAFTAVLGVAVVLLLPLYAVAAQMHANAFGVLAGLTVYAVPQVLAATAPISSLSAQVGTFVKLVRVLMLGPLVLAIAVLHRRRSGACAGGWSHFVPWFILGFLAMMAARSLGWLQPPVLGASSTLAQALTLLAMAGLGLGVDIWDVARAGPRVALAVVLSLLILAMLALALLHLLPAI